MKIGVTGGAGFIGGHVVDTLIQRGHEPLVFDHLGRYGPRPANTDVMLGDIRDATAMTELAAHVDGIIHLAAVLGTQETISNPLPAAQTNLEGGINFLQALRQYDLPGVYICVGNHWMNNAYSISKTAVERFCHMYQAEHGTRVNQVRVVNAYGPRQLAAAPFGPGRVRKITPAFACRALSGMPVEVYGTGEQVSDMVAVEDVALVLVRALEHAAAGRVFSRVVEVGPERHTRVRDVAQAVIDAAATLGHAPVPIVELPMRPGEDPTTPVTADPATLALVGMRPDQLTPLDQGIARTVRWFAEHEGDTWHKPAPARQPSGVGA